MCARITGRSEIVVPSGLRLRWEWVPSGLPWIDPLKEIQADALAVEKGFATQEQIQIKRGTDPSIIGQKPAAPKRPALAVVPSEDDDDEQQQEESA